MRPRIRDWIIMLALGALLGILTSCRTGQPMDRPKPEAGRKLVARVLTYGSGRPCDYETERCGNGQWRSSPYSRVDDLGNPPWVFLAGDGTACAEWQFILAVPRSGETWKCSTPWRARR